MKTDLNEIRERLVAQFQDFLVPLKVRKSGYECYELSGKKKAMQGKQEVDGFYFASVVPKPKDVRLYFFPIYTHAEEYGALSDELKKCLKGKSCFHIKKLSEHMEAEIKEMIQKGVDLYIRDGLI